MRDHHFSQLAWEAEKRSFKQKWSSYQEARVCSTKIYKTIRSSDQTNSCVELAARYYYNKLHPGRFLIDLEALDSHAFDRQTEDASDCNAYFHVNFKAKLGSRNSAPSLFFAELKGTEGPEKVNICTELTLSGISHPKSDFIGCSRHTKRKK